MENIGIEVALIEFSKLSHDKLIEICTHFLCSQKLRTGTVITGHELQSDNVLSSNVKYIIIEENSKINGDFDIKEVILKWYFYTLDENEPEEEISESHDGERINLANHWILPSAQFCNLWENLIYENCIKENLLNYTYTTLLFSDKGVDPNVINFNRVVLLHGPPGTGKTSLCKALAQKLSVRFQNRFKRGVLVELNTHSLFSKWFSESAKMVMKMFAKIKDIIEQPQYLVCVLIDEVESLAHARQNCLSGNDPSDSIRVVNTVLTQIDQLKRFPNVIILTTSNMTGAIDLAFVDRADIKQYIGPPGIQAIYQIYSSCVQELCKTKIITPPVFIPTVNAFAKCDIEGTDLYGQTLLKLSEESLGFSGRTLRKIPFLAHALFMKNNNTDFDNFLTAMNDAIQSQKGDARYFVTSQIEKKRRI